MLVRKGPTGNCPSHHSLFIKNHPELAIDTNLEKAGIAGLFMAVFGDFELEKASLRLLVGSKSYQTMPQGFFYHLVWC